MKFINGAIVLRSLDFEKNVITSTQESFSVNLNSSVGKRHHLIDDLRVNDQVMNPLILKEWVACVGYLRILKCYVFQGLSFFEILGEEGGWLYLLGEGGTWYFLAHKLKQKNISSIFHKDLMKILHLPKNSYNILSVILVFL